MEVSEGAATSIMVAAGVDKDRGEVALEAGHGHGAAHGIEEMMSTNVLLSFANPRPYHPDLLLWCHGLCLHHHPH